MSATPTTATGSSPVIAQYLCASRRAIPTPCCSTGWGDFYELFFDDADAPRSCSTSRSPPAGARAALRSRWAGVPAPCGRVVPREAPSARGNRPRSASRSAIRPTSRGPVERQVTRIVTPGTLTDEYPARRPPRQPARRGLLRRGAMGPSRGWSCRAADSPARRPRTPRAPRPRSNGSARPRSCSARTRRRWPRSASTPACGASRPGIFEPESARRVLIEQLATRDLSPLRAGRPPARDTVRPAR